MSQIQCKRYFFSKLAMVVAGALFLIPSAKALEPQVIDTIVNVDLPGKANGDVCKLMRQMGAIGAVPANEPEEFINDEGRVKVLWSWASHPDDPNYCLVPKPFMKIGLWQGLVAAIYNRRFAIREQLLDIKVKTCHSCNFGVEPYVFKSAVEFDPSTSYSNLRPDLIEKYFIFIGKDLSFKNPVQIPSDLDQYLHEIGLPSTYSLPERLMPPSGIEFFKITRSDVLNLLRELTSDNNFQATSQLPRYREFARECFSGLGNHDFSGDLLLFPEKQYSFPNSPHLKSESRIVYHPSEFDLESAGLAKFGCRLNRNGNIPSHAVQFCSKKWSVDHGDVKIQIVPMRSWTDFKTCIDDY
mgnify:CR=1 FL=1